MAIDIFGLQPHQVSRDLKGYALMFYGEPKTGKTTTAARFPRSLLLAFEKGYSAIPGVLAQPINTWTEFLKVLRQLKSDEAKAQFDNIIIDTADIAYALCEKYIVSQNGATDIADQKKLPYGKGYQLVEKEFDEKLRQIMQDDYGLIIISHSVDKVFKDEATGEEYNKIVPTLDKRGSKIITRMADIIGYARPIDLDDGSIETRLFLRGTPRFVAGSRFEAMPLSIEFNYQNLVDTIGDAVDAIEAKYGSDSVTSSKTDVYQVQEIDKDVEELIQEFGEIASDLVEKDEAYYVPRIKIIVDNALGKDNKIGDATPDQVDLVDLAVSDLKDLASKAK